MTATKTFGVFDWTGKRLFNGKTWDTFLDAWEAVYEVARKELGEDCSEKDWDDFLGEYYVEELENEET